MSIKSILSNIFNEVSAQIDTISEAQLNEFKNAIINANHLFLAGTGRSGLMISAFANRLMHLGKSVSLISEISKPKATKGDLLILGSNSGETKSLIVYAKQAKELGINIILLTANSSSNLAKLADSIIVTPINVVKLSQPMGSTFEQLSLLIYDSLVYSLMEELQQTPEMMKCRHANIE
ncbi:MULTISPECIES: 6-phospho-3-hexuloisomerase [unclassified Gilliamella]|uniref:6-phospho-3-hexuloisomerase n=1 Tax=unclassified Gilliamella TaxID=2685620 RepID=UPI00130D31C9|nr:MULTISPECIES: 6-phospho-3-hexuloisomerase [unclassified Gilliamella]MWP49073.1 SIS domain-containing protein [Gilliamella sp. Lep-s35]MWP69313.1 SIS domain-containing protein [Gilliamella sp. Lep-s5]MWP76876.1 SIS domain-containing protein [Gilliamella sp. Lep-s21]